MKTGHHSLRGYIKHLRRDAIEHDGVVLIGSVPLFVLIAYFVEDALMFDAISHAIDDGDGDPVNLDAYDRRQTSRLESRVMELAEGDVTISEILNVEWFDLDAGPRGVSLCIAMMPEEDLLVLHDLDAVPSFSAIAVGMKPHLLEVAADAPERVLPCLGSNAHELRRVDVRTEVSWTDEMIASVVTALTGLRQSSDPDPLVNQASRQRP